MLHRNPRPAQQEKEGVRDWECPLGVPSTSLATLKLFIAELVLGAPSGGRFQNKNFNNDNFMIPSFLFSF